MEEQDRIIKRPSTYPIFSKNLALQPSTVVDFANQCRKHFQQFNQGFKRRITIQMQYAKNLQGLSKSLDKYIQPGTQKAISFICSAFKVENEQRAHQARELAQSLRTQIYDICLNTYKEQANVIKRIEKDVKKYVKEFESLEDTWGRAKESYEKVSEDMEELIITKNYLKYTSEIPQDKKTKIISRTMQSIKQKKEYQKLFTSATRNYNDFVRQYNKCITQDLNQLQTQIRQQITLQSDCLRKLIVCEVSMFKNIEYDLINISKQMEALDNQKDVELLVEVSQNSLENLIIDAEEYRKLVAVAGGGKDKRKSVGVSDISSVVSLEDEGVVKLLQPKDSEIDKGMTAVVLKQVEEEVFSKNLANKRNKDFKELIERRWNQLNPKTISKPQTTANSAQQKKQEPQPQPQQQTIPQPQPSTQQKQPQVPQQKVTQTKEQPNPPSPEPQQPHQPTTHHLFDQYFTTSPFSKQFLQSKKQQQKPTVYTQVYDNFMIITRYISQLWNGLPVSQMQVKKKAKSDGELGTLNYVKKVLSVSHFYRIVAYAFFENFRTHHQVMVQNSDRAREVGKFVTALLTKSSKQNDIFVLRGLLGLLFTYFWTQSGSKKLLYSQPSIYKHSLFKKQDFWDSAIFESTYQQMLSFGPQKNESFQQTILREKNLIFTQLASYCHYMIMLGISSKNVRQIVGRYCRLYEMTDDQNRDLSKMITNTVKQYKEIFVVKATDKEAE